MAAFTATDSIDVELYVDPTCPWSWTAYQWLDAAASHRRLRRKLKPFSLAVRDGVDHLPAPLRAVRLAGHRALRVLAALDDEAGCRFYSALSEPIFAALAEGRRPRPDVAAALARAGLDAGLAAFAEDARWDSVIRDSMTAAYSDLGVGLAVLDRSSVEIPTIVLVRDGTRSAFRGPLLDPAPQGADAVTLWDAVAGITALPGMYEISRSRPRHHSLVASLAAVRPSSPARVGD